MLIKERRYLVQGTNSICGTATQCNPTIRGAQVLVIQYSDIYLVY